MIGITTSGYGIGDKIIISSFPENYYKNTGEKLIDVHKSWVFNYNPYIIRDEIPSKIINFWNTNDINYNLIKECVLPSVAANVCENFKFETYLRHPRLYVYEDLPIKNNQIAVHLNGISVGDCPDYIVEQIINNYQGFDLLQIGTKNDYNGNPTKHYPGLINMLGLDIWDSVKIISESIIFIGIDSGMMNVSFCYPRVNKKIIILYEPEYIKKTFPMASNNIYSQWLDHSFSYFNKFDKDIGFTYSYKKI